jgi:hypothetical protein
MLAKPINTAIDGAYGLVILTIIIGSTALGLRGADVIEALIQRAGVTILTG